jgi:cellulose synthase/poly-beta-1,6-N-acetylglucosamine synthase-like glycosyltransferase
MAHNEAANIGRLLAAVAAQRTATAELTEIIVIASGCTDRTADVVQAWAERDPRVRLVVQRQREGKAAAVNLFIASAREAICLVCSADLIPAADTIEQIVAPFAASDVAMTTCRPVPVNDPGTFMGFAAHLLWNLHHRINLRSFKAGELIGFRKEFADVPRSSAVDEASIESAVQRRAGGVRYVAEAITYNKGPETVREFLRQRRRIHAGHLWLRDAVGYRVSTLRSLPILGLTLRHLDWRPKQFVWTWAVAVLEAYGRLLGRFDFQRRYDHSIWAVAPTTKRLASETIEAAVAVAPVAVDAQRGIEDAVT